MTRIDQGDGWFKISWVRRIYNTLPLAPHMPLKYFFFVDQYGSMFETFSGPGRTMVEFAL